MTMAEYASDETFKEKVLDAGKPVLVDFFAPWCGPCRALSPVIDEVAEEANGKFDVYKVNVDESPRIATEYNIRSVPTLIAFKNGMNVLQLTGYIEKVKLKEAIDKAFE